MGAAGRRLVFVPAGWLDFGDRSYGEVGEGLADERPTNRVWMPAFYMENLEVDHATWTQTLAWAATNGYTDLAEGEAGYLGEADASFDHPVTAITWHDAVKWCNARSEREGLTPVYHTDSAFTNPVRVGTPILTDSEVNWSGNGYRLPVELEWEVAARAAGCGRYPWAGVEGEAVDQFDPAKAHVESTGTVACGQYPANPRDIHDLAGNIAEWCWDDYDPDRYAVLSPASAPADLRGSEPSMDAVARAVRGGSWYQTAASARCAARDAAHPGRSDRFTGLRVVRGFDNSDDIDLDADGLPDWWETTYYGHATNAQLDADDDGDGAMNEAEWRAGTDPQSATSVLAAQARARAAGPVLEWATVSTRVYRVYWSTNMNEAFQELASNLTPTDGTLAYTDTLHSAVSPIYYRIRAERP